jgi:hypothetical protein
MADQKKTLEVIEKRRFLRLNDYFKVSYLPTDEVLGTQMHARAEVGYSKNVSLGGIAFVTDGNIDVGDTIRATIGIPELDSPIEVVGEVVRALDAGGGRRDIAVKFLPFGMDEDQRTKLELFIYDHFLTDPF